MAIISDLKSTHFLIEDLEGRVDIYPDHLMCGRGGTAAQN